MDVGDKNKLDSANPFSCAYQMGKTDGLRKAVEITSLAQLKIAPFAHNTDSTNGANMVYDVITNIKHTIEKEMTKQ